MPKAQALAIAAQQAAIGAGLERRPGPGQQRAQQRGLDERRQHTGQIQQRPRVGRQLGGAGQHGVADGGRQLRGLACEKLGDKKRVAAGGRKHRLRVAPGATRPVVHGGARQRGQRQAQREIGGQRAQHAQQRRAGAGGVVAVAQHQQRARAVDAPAEVAQQIQRGAVGPVHVLDHQHRGRRSLAQQLQHAGQHLLALRARAHRQCQRGRQLVEQVDQRAQGLRRQQRLTGAPQPAHAAGMVAAQAAQQAGLAHAGLTVHQHASALGIGALQVLQALGQRGQWQVALQQLAVSGHAGSRQR